MTEQENTNPLSERELQVVQMVATGASNQQIAKELVISINTVKVHMRNIFEKLGVQSRTEASMRAIQEGWVTVAESNGTNKSAESPQSTAKTFLLPTQTPSPLKRWQQIYLSIAIIFALALLLLPFSTQPVLSETPYIPVVISQTDQQLLYNQPETPDPLLGTGANANTWMARKPMTLSRAGLGLAAYEGKLYAIGGVKSSNSATRFVEIYDPATDSWTEGGGKPTPVTDIQAITVDDKIYVPGGCTNDNAASNIFEIYLPTSETWITGPQLPNVRCGYGLALHKEKLYLFGGRDGQTFTDTIFVYDISQDEWRTLETTLPMPNGYMGAVSLGKEIFLVGGYNGVEASNQAYLFDPETSTWTEKAPMLEKRGGIGIINLNDEIFAVGGGWNQALEYNEKYDPTADKWTQFEIPATHRWRNFGLTVIDTQIYAVGGWNGTEDKFMNDIVSYNVLYQIFLPFSDIQ